MEHVPQKKLDPGVEMVREANAAFGNHTARTPHMPRVSPEVARAILVEAQALAAQAQHLKRLALAARQRGDEMAALLLIRIQLSVEETGEFAEALGMGDLEHAAKELVDMSYVTDGHYLTLGLGDLKLPLYREVHRSNMTKLCPETGRPIISDAGRWVKGPAYEVADVARVLAGRPR